MSTPLHFTKGILVAFVFFMTSDATNAGLVNFEGNTFPEKEGWERRGSGDVIRSLHDGYFNQFAYLPGILDAYRLPVSSAGPEVDFFLQWRVETDVPSSELDLSHTPVVVSAGGTGPYYHFVITEDRVAFSRSNFLPTIFVDIAPNAFHEYRLELYGSESYSWAIDGQIIDSGVPLGSFLDNDPTVNWGVRRFGFDFTTQWDYIRYGTIPEPATVSTLLLGSLFLFRRRATA